MLTSNPNKDFDTTHKTKTIKLSVNNNYIGKVFIDHDSPEFIKFTEFINAIVDRNIHLLDLLVNDEEILTEEDYNRHIEDIECLMIDIKELGFILDYGRLTIIAHKLINITNSICFRVTHELYFDIIKDEEHLFHLITTKPFITEILSTEQGNKARYVIYTNEKVIRGEKAIREERIIKSMVDTDEEEIRNMSPVYAYINVKISTSDWVRYIE